jgi:hypothetical protein
MHKNEAACSNASTKKVWNKPQLRAVVPAKHTRGGAFPNGPREDTAYRVS